MRFAATSAAPSRRRLKFDATQPLTLRESVQIVAAREAKKLNARKQVSHHIYACPGLDIDIKSLATIDLYSHFCGTI